MLIKDQSVVQTKIQGSDRRVSNHVPDSGMDAAQIFSSGVIIKGTIFDVIKCALSTCSPSEALC